MKTYKIILSIFWFVAGFLVLFEVLSPFSLKALSFLVCLAFAKMAISKEVEE